MKRRSFLHWAGFLLAALGLEESGLVRLSDRYYNALAEPTPRKLALLVGINQYAGSPLQGCLTDVELQKELLIHRFGFQPSDILVLADQQASRENIQTALIEHLTKQVKPGDVVVFHFSGYGSRLEKLATNNTNSESESPIINPLLETQNLLLPIDAFDANKPSEVNGVLIETLSLWQRSLATDKTTIVLDTSYNYPGTSMLGNLRVRSQPQIAQAQLNSQALLWQTELQQQFLESPLLLSQQIPPLGVILAAAGEDQSATEGKWDGFNAGFFTYALTQYLWQTTPATTVRVNLSRAAATVVQIVGNNQQPRLLKTNDVALIKNTAQQKWPNYHLMPDANTAADGVVMAVQDNGTTGLLWLGGLPITVLAFYGVNSLLTVLPRPGNEVNSSSKLRQILIRERSGLQAKATIFPSPTDETNLLEAGELLQEAIRVLPRNIGLTVALDASLKRIERVDATSAIAGIPNISLVASGEVPADCVLGILQKQHQQASSQSLTPNPQYGLFSPSLNPIPNTVGEAGEAVKTAVQRLVPKLQTLLAAKLLRLSSNEESSRLGVQATLEMVTPTEQILMYSTTNRAGMSTPARDRIPQITPGNGVEMNESGILKLPIGSSIQYRLSNYNDVPVYFVLLGTDSNGNAITFLTPKSTSNSDTSPTIVLKQQVIPPGETVLLPDAASPFKWIVGDSPGINEIQLIFSKNPFLKMSAALEATQHPRVDYERLGTLVDPLTVAQAVLEDLHQASFAGSAELLTTLSADSWAFDVNVWATLTFIYEEI